MSILKNAVDSIAIGLEDYNSSDQRRIISCTRNMFAGILLLFKHKLSLLSDAESDEALIKQQVLPSIGNSKKVIWIGKGKKTVDVQSIKDRFKSLAIEVDWKRLDKVNNFRNDIEHYYSNLEHEAVRTLISDSFIIIRDFISNNLNQDPKDVLGDKSWSILIEINEVYEKEKLECKQSIRNLDYFNNEILFAFEDYSCEKCGSDLIKTISSGDALMSEFLCKSCGTSRSYEEIVDTALSSYFEYEAYLSVKDGGETPIIDCPSCGDGVYMVGENICSLCGFSAERVCQRCAGGIPPEELSDGSLCGYCEHLMSKDD